jgi:hypothetical protein
MTPVTIAQLRAAPTVDLMTAACAASPVAPCGGTAASATPPPPSSPITTAWAARPRPAQRGFSPTAAATAQTASAAVTPSRTPARPGAGRPCPAEITTAAVNAHASGRICWR